MSSQMMVRDKVCDQCLLSKNKIVSDASRDAILEECNQSHQAFECHKGTIVRNHIVCRGFFDQNLSLVVRLAKMLEAYTFVNEVGEQSHDNQTQTSH